jgi:CHAT domain-containing protein
MSYDSRPDLVRGGAYFRPLPGTKVEVESIATLAQRYQWQVALYTSDNASEANLNRISPPTVLHIATHGYFLKDTTSVQRLSKRALLNSGLVMAGALDSTRHTPLSDNDGLLTAYEATALRLSQTELVALSACETGLGELRSGNGVFGLQRAFFAAGARSVLMSLWKVNDQTTQMFMAKFYGYWLAGKPKSTALRLAQEDIRNTSEQLSHPFYWGGFVLLEQ